MSKPAKGEMTIHELAKRTGMTVRNIRAHQTRGLLPPPVVRGRTGYYNEDHVSRIRLTRAMQADGLNLEAIRRVLGAGSESAAEMSGFTRALRASFGGETPEIIEAEELAKIWNQEPDEEARLTRRAEEGGFLRTLPDGRIEMISPRLFRASGALAEFGVSREVGVIAAEELRKQIDGIARTFIDLFVREIWQPFEDAGLPEGEWSKVRKALERLQSLAAEALLGIFQIAMAEEVEKAVEEAGEQLNKMANSLVPAEANSAPSGEGAQRKR